MFFFGKSNIQTGWYRRTKAGPASDLEARPPRKKFVRRTAQKPQSKRKTIMANRQLNMNDASVVQAQTAPSGHVSTLYPTVAAIFRRWRPASAIRSDAAMRTRPT